MTEDMIGITILGTFIIGFIFLFMGQNISFLKKDIKCIEKKLEKIQEENFELRHQISSLKYSCKSEYNELMYKIIEKERK